MVVPWIGFSGSAHSLSTAQAFRQWMGPGDAIVVTNQDHEANSGPWRRLAADGFEIREWQIDPETGLLDPADLETLLDERVRLVCFPHCSNVVGYSTGCWCTYYLLMWAQSK